MNTDSSEGFQIQEFLEKNPEYLDIVKQYGASVCIIAIQSNDDQFLQEFIAPLQEQIGEPFTTFPVIQGAAEFTLIGSMVGAIFGFAYPAMEGVTSKIVTAITDYFSKRKEKTELPIKLEVCKASPDGGKVSIKMEVSAKDADKAKALLETAMQEVDKVEEKNTNKGEKKK